MFRNKLILHQYVLFGVVGLLILTGLLTGNFVFGLNLLWWILGSVLGFMIVFFDRLANMLVTKTDQTMNLRLKEVWTQKQVTKTLDELLNERGEQKDLVMRSFLFLLVWVVMAFFTVTSVNSQFARGMMLGIGIHLIFDFLYDYFWDKPRFTSWFWQIKREISQEEQLWIVWAMGLIFLILVFRF